MAKYSFFNGSIMLNTKMKMIHVYDNVQEKTFFFDSLDSLFKWLSEQYDEARIAYEEDKREECYE